MLRYSTILLDLMVPRTRRSPRLISSSPCLSMFTIMCYERFVSATGEAMTNTGDTTNRTIFDVSL